MIIATRIDEKDIFYNAFEYLYKSLQYESFEIICREIFNSNNLLLKSWLNKSIDYFIYDDRIIPLLNETTKKENNKYLIEELEETINNLKSDKNMLL